MSTKSKSRTETRTKPAPKPAETTAEAQGLHLLSEAAKLAKLPEGDAILVRLVAGIEALTPAGTLRREKRKAAAEGITEAHEYLNDAPDVFLRLMAAMQDPQSLDAFDLIAEAAGLVDAARTNVRDAVEATRTANGAATAVPS